MRLANEKYLEFFRFVIGNPLIMKEMAKDVPDAGSHAPVTVLIDKRPDGVHTSYDRMASFETVRKCRSTKSHQRSERQS